MKRIEFSKKIFIGVSLGTIIISIFSMYMSWKTNDMSVFAYLIPAMFAELATSTGFYYNKAKEENIRKIENSNKNIEGDIKDGLDN